MFKVMWSTGLTKEVSADDFKVDGTNITFFKKLPSGTVVAVAFYTNITAVERIV